MNKANMEAALLEMQKLQIPARRAAIIVAVSTGESNNTFGIARDATMIYPTACYPSRQILKLEDGVSATNVLTPAWRSRPGLMAWLKAQGYLESNAAGTNFWLNGKVSAYDNPQAPNQHVARVFEYLIDQRYTDALRSFSIGPTQMYLRYSPALGASTPIPTRFTTLEELFGFYTARDIAHLMGPWFDYLNTSVASYPTESSDSCGNTASNNCVEKWLQTYQTGQRDWSDPYWANYARNFLQSVRMTWSLMRNIGYTIA